MKYAALVIRDRNGNIVDVTLSSEKSRNKSVEQGELWIVDIDTRRVLPYRGGGVRLDGSFDDGGFRGNERWFEVVVDGAAVPPGEETGSIEVAERSDDTAPHRQDDATSLDASVGPLLADLTATIADRRRTLPEGSYTTHLFTKGSAKIRKKTGEEAVELILAHDRDELVSEAADLIYHLMVLLETEELTIADVINRLAERHQRG